MYKYRRRAIQIGLLESAFARIADVQSQFADYVLDKRFAAENFDFIIDILGRRYDAEVFKSTEVIAGISAFFVIFNDNGGIDVIYRSSDL